MVLINLHRNLHEKSSFLSEIMFIRINPYLCHLLTRYQSTIFPNHKSCVRKKGVPERVQALFLHPAPCTPQQKRRCIRFSEKRPGAITGAIPGAASGRRPMSDTVKIIDPETMRDRIIFLIL